MKHLPRGDRHTRQDVLLRGVPQSCQPTRISSKSSQFVQDSVTDAPPFARGSMASGVECRVAAGHARQHVRFSPERKPRPEHPFDPRHSPLHQEGLHRDNRSLHRRSQRLGLDCGWGEFHESRPQSRGTTTTRRRRPRRQICQRQWTTHVCQVHLGRRRPGDR